MVSEENVAFVTKLTPDGTRVIYEIFFRDRIENTQGIDLAVDALGQAYLHYTSGYNASIGVVRFSPAGSENGGFGGRPYYVDAMAMGPSGDLFAVGWAYSQDDPNELYTEFYLGRMDASSGAVVETLLADRQTVFPRMDVAATPGNGAVVVEPESDGLYVTEHGPTGEEVFSRGLNLGAVEILDVAVTSSGEIVVGVHTGSETLILRLEGGTGEVISSMTFAYASAIAVGPGGDIYVASGGRVARYSENRPPDCSGATASPSVIWPANGKMVPVSILGVTDPQSDPVTVEITGITQDESGAAFSGIGSPAAQVKAERDGKGDGRVYRIQFEAADPSGVSCTGEVNVCVPHDRGKGSCVDGNR